MTIGPLQLSSMLSFSIGFVRTRNQHGQRFPTELPRRFSQGTLRTALEDLSFSVALAGWVV